MIDKKFDKILQEKLKGHQVKLGEANWADMEKMLNKSEHSDSMDREVKNRLLNHTVEYKESHWQILKGKLELEKKLKEKIYLSKIAEFSILTLIIFSVFHYNGQASFKSVTKSTATPFVYSGDMSTMQAKTEITSDPVEKEITSSSLTSQESQNQQSFQNRKLNTVESTFQNSTSSQKQIELSQELQVNDVHSTFGPINAEKHSTEIRISEKTNSSIQKDTDAKNSILAPHFTTSNSSKQVKQLSGYIKPLNTVDNIPESLVSILKKSPFDFTDKLETNLDRKLESDDHIARLTLINSLYKSPLLPIANVSIASLPHKNEKWIGAMTGVDINLIGRPFDPDKKASDPQNFAVVSLTTGANYSVKKAKNEFFTGVGYSRKFYDPALYEVFQISSSFYSRDYTLEKYDIIHVPAQYKRHLGESHKLHAYVFGGVSMNFVIYTDYEQQDNLRRGQPRSKQIIDIKASYNDNGFSGLLEGGYYKDNIYFTADAGFGFEKQFNKLKLFFESQYKRNLFSSQLGPRKVKLNSLSFNVGTKYRI